jgi:tetratricopeptide (TPR) repeat protein
MSDAQPVQIKVAAAARLIDAGNALGAERFLAEALAMDPEHPRANALMALALYRRHRFAASIQQADVAIGLSPTADALRFKALALIGQNRFKFAVEVAEAAVRAAPEDELASLVLGIALENAKRPRQAEAAFRRAVALIPTQTIKAPCCCGARSPCARAGRMKPVISRFGCCNKMPTTPAPCACSPRSRPVKALYLAFGGVTRFSWLPSLGGSGCS